MQLGSLIDKDFIIKGDKFSSIIECVDYLSELFIKKKILRADLKIVNEKVRDREKLGGTVLPNGLALPHARVEGVNDLITGVWIPDTPIQTDEGEVRILFYFITSITGSPLYLPVLSAVAKNLMLPETLDKLVNYSKDEVHNFFNDISIKKEVTVEDIMTPDPITCTKDTTLAELSDIFYKNTLSYLPVVDKKGKQVGEVTIKDILSKGVPDYIKRIGNIKFMKTLEPFEALLRQEDSLTVGDIMRKSGRKISKDASIIEAVVTMTEKGYRHIPVVEDSKVVGIISETDILKKVIRG